MLDGPRWTAAPQRNRSAALHRPPHCIEILIGKARSITPAQILLNDARYVRSFGAHDANENALGRDKDSMVFSQEGDSQYYETEVGVHES